jgi:hypothetical protein
VYVLERRAAGFLPAFGADDQGAVVQHPGVPPIAFHYAITRRAGGCGVHSEHPDSSAFRVVFVDAVHGHKSTVFPISLPEICTLRCVTSERCNKNDQRIQPRWPYRKKKSRKSNPLVRSDGRLDLRFVDIEVCIHMLYIVMLFEGFNQPNHLHSLCAGQLYVVLRNHADLC